jgi:geranylgeranyl pyrophosphate synthase
MELEQTRKILTSNLLDHLSWHLPRQRRNSLGNINEVYEYSLFPTGKLFRPLLVWAVAKDFAKELDFSPNSDHALLASCVEFHHTYSLLHDDLPSMDNDTVRRGKPCAHLAFNEWKALLAGDGLLNCSYQTLSKIKSDRLPEIFKLMGGLLGTKGLIQGQVLDLSGEMTKDFASLLETHKLKTARLIQFSLLSSLLLVESNYRKFLDLFRLGHRLGIVFQLLDDLTELTDFNLSTHEKEVNPWFNFKDQSLKELTSGLKIIQETLKKHRLSNLEFVVRDYFKSVEKIKDKPLVIEIPTSLIFQYFRFD